MKRKIIIIVGCSLALLLILFFVMNHYIADIYFDLFESYRAEKIVDSVDDGYRGVIYEFIGASTGALPQYCILEKKFGQFWLRKGVFVIVSRFDDALLNENGKLILGESETNIRLTEVHEITGMEMYKTVFSDYVHSAKEYITFKRIAVAGVLGSIVILPILAILYAVRRKKVGLKHFKETLKNPFSWLIKNKIVLIIVVFVVLLTIIFRLFLMHNLFFSGINAKSFHRQPYYSTKIDMYTYRLTMYCTYNDYSLYGEYISIEKKGVVWHDYAIYGIKDWEKLVIDNEYGYDFELDIGDKKYNEKLVESEVLEEVGFFDMIGIYLKYVFVLEET